MHDDDLSALIASWSTLHLAVAVPERVPGWDVICLTASGPTQAGLYRDQLERARAEGRIPAATGTLVVEDPDGRRIGSGGATLHALQTLQRVDPDRDCAGLRILLIHAGGDAKRLPWANLLGKAFIPLPLLADPDEAAPTLLDHLLALCAPLAMRLLGGGLVTLSGDVLPLCELGALHPPEDEALVVTTPVSLDQASRHGVIRDGGRGVVDMLLQKQDPDELTAAGAVLAGGSALLDTGVLCFRGTALQGLLAAAAYRPDPVEICLDAGCELSLYEELVGAMVPANRADVAEHPAGRVLLPCLHDCRLRHQRVDDLRFLHFGTTAEYLEDLARPWRGRMQRRILARHGLLLHPDATLIDSDLDPAVPVGSASMIYGSRLGPGTAVGNRCLLLHVDCTDELRVPDHRCLWQVPLGGTDMVTLCCGVDDNPKAGLAEATFVNRSLTGWLAEHTIEAGELWPADRHTSLWTARLFPRHPEDATPWDIVRWLSGGTPDAGTLRRWRQSERLSMAQVAREAQAERFRKRLAALADGLVLDCIENGARHGQERDLRTLGQRLHGPAGRERLTAVLDGELPALIPDSRRQRIRADLYATLGRTGETAAAGRRAFAAVGEEVARAVGDAACPTLSGLEPGTRIAVTLPVRFDIAGGWSDTPPWCLERTARVLNLAVRLDTESGRADGGAAGEASSGIVDPVMVGIESLDRPLWILESADGDHRAELDGAAVQASRSDLSDPFHLARSCLELAGFGSHAGGITQGLHLRTRTDIPRGSGLGTSSILGAAILTALQQLAGRPDDPETISRLVLQLEQRMGTGGGWQDQVGGLHPGAKVIESRPVSPLRLAVTPIPLPPAVVAELESRLVLAFTGQERLAKNILQIVVGRYLQRNGRLIGAIRQLVDLADRGRDALARGDLDRVGAVMTAAWRAHQILDPHCSNPQVDRLLAKVHRYSCGHKLAGAGGGGFCAIMARDAEAAELIRATLNAMPGGVHVYDWRLAIGPA